MIFIAKYYTGENTMFEFIKNFFKKEEAKVEAAVAPYKTEVQAVVAKVEAVEEKVVAEVKEVAAKVKKPRKPKTPK
jgi:DNA-binding transcriptional regulator GbsR (MarR family)